MELSTADSNKWLTLLNSRLDGQKPDDSTASDYQLVGPISQRQRRLTEARVAEMAARYEEGATVYELAEEFGCHRTTVASKLKKFGITMRLQSPSPEMIEFMVLQYESGLSLVEIGVRTNTSAGAVRKCINASGVEIRDTHGRRRDQL